MFCGFKYGDNVIILDRVIVKELKALADEIPKESKNLGLLIMSV